MKGLSKAQFAESVMRLKGQRYSLDRYPMFRAIYNVSDDVTETLLKTGRQVSKSTFNAKEILVDSMRIPHLNTLFVTPLQEQTARFSRNYLGEGIMNTPFIQKYFWHTMCQNNIFSRGLSNGSLVQLTYSLLDAERARGIPADKLVFDEVQDIPIDNIPIINECLSASPYKWKTYTGTPKTLDNTIEYYWLKSTMCEWGVTCPFCRNVNIPDDDHVWDMIGPYGPICLKCKADLRNDVHKGTWVTTNKDYLNSEVVGFHLPQIIMPIHYDSKKAWKELLIKKSRYAPAQFANECLGLSYDQGGRLLTLSELKAVSSGKVWDKWEPDIPIEHAFAGIDWGISAQTSYTILVIGGIDPLDKRFKVVYIKKFYSTDTLDQIDQIIGICKRFNVLRIGADVGVGHTNNLILDENYGVQRVFKMNYTATRKRVLEYNKRGFFSLDRTISLNLMFMAIKQGQVQFPPESFMDLFYPDFMTIYEEIVESRRGISKVFTRNPKIPDDVVHALNFCMFTAYKYYDHEYTRMATNHDFLVDEALGLDFEF